MANTALNRTSQVLGTNKSGGSLNQGDVVVLDNTNDNGFTTTTSAGLSTRGIGVILEPNGIANNASGMIAVGGWCPKINLNTSATDGQFIKTHTVAGQGTPHASPQVEGDFAVALTASSSPAAILFGSPNAPSGGGTPGGSNTQVQYNNSSAFGGITGATTDGTTLTLVAPVLGTPASGTLTNCTGLPTAGLLNSAVTLAKIANAAASSKLLGSGASGSGSPYAELTLGTNLSMSGTTLNASAGAGSFVFLQTQTAATSSELDFTSFISATYEVYRFEFENVLPTTNGDSLLLQVGTGAGPSWDTGSNYKWAAFASNQATATGATGASTGTSVALLSSLSNTSTEGFSGTVTLYNPSSTSSHRILIWQGGGLQSSGNYSQITGSAKYLSTTAITGVRLIPSTGASTLATGTVRVYGLTKS